ncbi:MAG: response regulator [Candidatus Fermentithermobacillus carboniphilus]|uniref:Response regulator n=1 Tax=Candidatus Fermentithermobacillus carboniphilus TaxID=3085328 RepID=A0AAT9LCA9_9FIRM|nr:MAG: response regulator [Candidatus Fermentithermobacillus carboniphilus]
MKLLIADDEPIVRRFIREVVTKHCPEFVLVGEATSGAELLRLAVDLQPDVVLTDIRMPNVDGLEAARRIRAALPDVHIIILSAYEEFEYARQAIAVRAEDYLVKPLRPETLQKALNDCLECHRQLQHERGRMTRALLGARPAGYSAILEGIYNAISAGDVTEVERLAPAVRASHVPQSDLDQIVGYLEEAACSSGLAPLATEMSIKQILSNGTSHGTDDMDPAEVVLAVAKHLASAVARFRLHGSTRLVHAAARIIEQSYRSPLRLEEIADMMHVSQYYFSRLFKREIGVTFSQYLALTRIRAAQGLLSETSAQVKEIAKSVGYNDARYFGERFKSLTGVQPTQFKSRQFTK